MEVSALDCRILWQFPSTTPVAAAGPRLKICSGHGPRALCSPVMFLNIQLGKPFLYRAGFVYEGVVMMKQERDEHNCWHKGGTLLAKISFCNIPLIYPFSELKFQSKENRSVNILTNWLLTTSKTTLQQIDKNIFTFIIKLFIFTIYP